MELRIEKVVYPGRSLARERGKVVFTDEGLPGELVEAELVSDKANYAEARTARIIEASASRVAPRCSHFRVCSLYQYIDYPVQLEIKRSQVQEMFSHHLKLPLEDLPIAPSPEVWGYRNKVQLHLVREGDEFSWAYHEPKSPKKFVKISECFLLPDRMNAFLKALLGVIREKKLGWIEEAVVRESASRGEILLLLLGRSPRDLAPLRDGLAPLLSSFPVSGVVLGSRREGKKEETRFLGEGSLEEAVEGVVYSIGPSSFFQVNLEMLRKVMKDLKQALPLTGEETVADLYCGVGTFGLNFAPRAREIIGVESSPDSTPYLKRNIIRNRAGNFTALEGESGEWASRLLARKIDILLADPPRPGLERELREEVLGRPPPRMVYLSCDLATFIRDLKQLSRVYRLSRLFLYDFFPHTPHLELCAILER